MHKAHDHSYKLLFSEPEIIVDLLREFVCEAWVDELDFKTLEKVSGSYVSDDLRAREDDVIWRVKYRQSWIYVYLLIEFQSTVDRYIAVRIMTYMGLLYQDLIKTGQCLPDRRLPPVFPVVLYNGEKRWDAPACVQDLIVRLPGGLEGYLPSLKYLILDEGAYEMEALTPLKNLVAAIFRLENAARQEDIIEVLANLIEWLSTPEQTRLRRSFNVWLNRVLQMPGELSPPVPKLNDLVEIKTMLSQRIPQWIREAEAKAEARGEARGELKGELKGEAKALLKLLKLKFGDIPVDVKQRVFIADKVQLDAWLERVLTADTLDELFS